MKFSRPPRRLDRILSDAPLYFVTCCTYRKRSKLANNEVHKAFIGFAERAASEFDIAVGRYVIMPDHLHLFVAGPNEFNLVAWVGVLKRTLAKSLPKSDSLDPLWQRVFFDHLLRGDESYAQKWDYVRENPVRAGLVTDAGAWPWRAKLSCSSGRSFALRNAAVGRASVEEFIPIHPQARESQREASTVPRYLMNRIVSGYR